MNKKRLVPYVAATIVFAVWGYAFELSFFLSLGLNPGDYLSPWHYILSSLQVLVPMLLAMAVITQLKKFFSKGVHIDDAKELTENLKEASFDQILMLARMIAVLSFVYFAVVVCVFHLDINFSVWAAGPYLLFMVLAYFLFAIILSPPHARVSVVVTFIFAEALCFAGIGCGMAHDSRIRPRSPVRDDFVVLITRRDDRLVIEAKSLPILPPVTGLIRKIF